MSDFYKAFEERYRGSRELITRRLQQYEPFVLPMVEAGVVANCLDLGCGRGEWLELLSSYGLTAQGVDLDAEMLLPARELGLNVSEADAIEHLKIQPDASIAVVSAFHLVEHLPFELLRKLVVEAYRVLMPGGLIILETPNPENIIVATSSFHLDPTHIRPVPPLLLSFIIEQQGFGPVKTVRLQEPKILHTPIQLNIFDVLSGVSPDYSIVAQKPGNDQLTKVLAEAFELEFGLGLEQLASRYDQQINLTTVALRSSEDRVWERIHELTEHLAEAKETLTKNHWERIHELTEHLAEAKETLTKYQLQTDYLLTRSFWEKLLFRPTGKPKRALRRVLFHKSGKPRGVFKSLVLHSDGRPHKPFRKWMTSPDYQNLRSPVRFSVSREPDAILFSEADLSPRATYFLEQLDQRHVKVR
jgi:O-antigen chain-terminating methyltransferase